MVRQKEEEVQPSQEEFVERVVHAVDREYGEGVMVDGQSVVNQTKMVVPVSPSIDIITGGGIEEGSWVGITGLPKTGKTSLCLRIAASAQKAEHGSRPVYYFKIEGRLSTAHLREVPGLDLGKGRFHVIQSRKGRILTGQDHLRIMLEVVKNVPGALLVLDSASALCDEAEWAGGLGTQVVGGNRAFAQFVRLASQVVPVNGTIILVITQLIANIGWGKSGMTEKVANAGKYQYDYMLRSLGKQAWKSGERQLGLKIKWVCNTSPRCQPGLSMDSYLRFGLGFDALYEAVQLGISVGLIKGKGWYTLDFLGRPEHQHLFDGQELPRFQGAERLYQALAENPAWARALEREVLALSGALATTTEE